MSDNKVVSINQQSSDQELLTAEEIFSAVDVEYATVKAWNGKYLRLQSVTAGDVIGWSEASEGDAKRTAGLRLIIKSAVDKDGRLMFSDKDLGMLRGKSQKITNDIVDVILKLNGLVPKAQQAAKND